MRKATSAHSDIKAGHIHPTTRMIPIGATGKYINGLAFKPTDWSDDGLPIIRIQNLTDRSKPMNRTKRVVEPAYLIQPGDLLVSWSATLDAFIWDGEPAILNQHIFKVIPDTDLVSKQYLFFALKQAIIEMGQTEHLHGSTMKHINRGPFLAHPIQVPSLPTQVKIVAELERQFSRVDQAVANLKRIKANLNRYKGSVLKAALEGRLVPNEAELAQSEGRNYECGLDLLRRVLSIRRSHWKGKARYEDPPQPDGSALPALPQGWAWARLEALASIKGGIAVDQKRKDPTSRSVPYLRVANVQRGHLDLAEIKVIDAPQTDIEELRLRHGDILFNEGGDRDKLGRGWIWEGQLPECIHQNHVFRARLFSHEVSPKLVSWWGNTFGRDYFLREGKQTTNLASINMTKLSRLPVPVPPLLEQNRMIKEIDRCLSFATAISRDVEAAIARASHLRASILSGLMNGQAFAQKN